MPAMNEQRDVPQELLELVLMRTFLKLFSEHESPFWRNSRDAITAAYGALARVCYNWWRSMNGWPYSRRQLRRYVKGLCRPYSVFPRLESSLEVSGKIVGVAYCDNMLFVVCDISNVISVFGSDNKPQTDVTVPGLVQPNDIVACDETKQLYIADAGSRSESDCIWRVTLECRRVEKWLPNESTSTTSLKPNSLSLTSRRLLVTSSYHKSALFLFAADGVELRRILLPSNIQRLRHAVETSRGTFIVSHVGLELELEPVELCEIDAGGNVLRVYKDQEQLTDPYYMVLDSDGRLLVADYDEDRVLLMNSRLELERILLNSEDNQLAEGPEQLVYVPHTRQLFVTSSEKSHFTQIYSLT